MLYKKTYLFIGCFSAMTISFLLSAAEDNSADQAQIVNSSPKVQIQTSSPSATIQNTAPTGYISASDYINAMVARQARIMEQMNDNFYYVPNSNFSAKSNYPQSKLISKNDKYVLQLIAPGIDKKDVTIKVDNRVLTISYEASKKVEDKNSDGSENYENCTSQFVQSVTIPADVDADKISSSYKDGILSVILPKIESKKQSQAKTIQVD